MPRRFSGAEVEGITSTHTVPKHTGPSSHSFIPWVGTPHVCTPHTVPLTIVDFCGHVHTQFQQSPIFHLIVIDFAPAHCILGPSLPNSTLLSNFLLSTFHTIVDLPGVSSVLWLGRSFGGVG